MKRLLVLTLATLALGVAACDDNDLTQGEVYNKKYHGAYYWYSSQCMGYDSKGNCTMTIQVPHYQPERFEICIHDPEKPKRHNCMDVSHDTYERVVVGTSYPKAM